MKSEQSKNLPKGDQNFTFADLFDLNELQTVQDAFAKAAGVASIITEPDGTPITQPSNFTAFCKDVIRKTEKGACNCMLSDSLVGSPKKDGPRIQKCFAGLIDGGASIMIGERHLASWLIGQIFDSKNTIDEMLPYADEIGVSRDVFQKELRKVKTMSMEHFTAHCDFLFLMAQQLSKMALKSANQQEEIARRVEELQRINASLERDITERKAAEERIRFLGYHDTLTGFYNRRFYEEESKRLDTPQNLPLSIVMGDVNGLKLINDSFGHAAGDELLKSVAVAMKEGCRAGEFIARIGGDEFVILLPGTDTAEAEKIVRRIELIAGKKTVESIHVSISFGIGTKRYQSETLQEIAKKAEDEMYKKKLFASQSMRGKTISAIITALHRKNKREELHSHNVAALCEKMGFALGLSDEEIVELKTAGLFHDIGKIAIDENLLNNTKPLNDGEWEEIKRHSEIGYRILSTVNDMAELAEYVLAHHERWDGQGYPKGIKEEQIPFVSRVIAIADSYDAMTSERSYQSILPFHSAVEVLQKNAGVKYDPALVPLFIEKVLGEKE